MSRFFLIPWFFLSASLFAFFSPEDLQRLQDQYGVEEETVPTPGPGDVPDITDEEAAEEQDKEPEFNPGGGDEGGPVEVYGFPMDNLIPALEPGWFIADWFGEFRFVESDEWNIEHRILGRLTFFPNIEGKEFYLQTEFYGLLESGFPGAKVVFPNVKHVDSDQMYVVDHLMAQTPPNHFSPDGGGTWQSYIFRDPHDAAGYMADAEVLKSQLAEYLTTAEDLRSSMFSMDRGMVGIFQDPLVLLSADVMTCMASIQEIYDIVSRFNPGVMDDFMEGCIDLRDEILNVVNDAMRYMATYMTGFEDAEGNQMHWNTIPYIERDEISVGKIDFVDEVVGNPLSWPSDGYLKWVVYEPEDQFVRVGISGTMPEWPVAEMQHMLFMGKERPPVMKEISGALWVLFPNDQGRFSAYFAGFYALDDECADLTRLLNGSAAVMEYGEPYGLLMTHASARPEYTGEPMNVRLKTLKTWFWKELVRDPLEGEVFGSVYEDGMDAIALEDIVFFGRTLQSESSFKSFGIGSSIRKIVVDEEPETLPWGAVFYETDGAMTNWSIPSTMFGSPNVKKTNAGGFMFVPRTDGKWWAVNYEWTDTSRGYIWISNFWDPKTMTGPLATNLWEPSTDVYYGWAFLHASGVMPGAAGGGNQSVRTNIVIERWLADVE